MPTFAMTSKGNSSAASSCRAEQERKRKRVNCTKGHLLLLKRESASTIKVKQHEVLLEYAKSAAFTSTVCGRSESR